MSRYTVKQLRHDVAEINRKLALSGSSRYFNVCPRNGYCAVDLRNITSLGVDVCVQMLWAGTPHDCGRAVLDEQETYEGRRWYCGRGGRATLRMAKRVIGRFMPVDGSHKALDGELTSLLDVWASLCRFKQPDNGQPLAVAFLDRLRKVK